MFRWSVDPFSEGSKPDSFVRVSELQLPTKAVNKRQGNFFFCSTFNFFFLFLHYSSGTAVNSLFSMNCVAQPTEKCPWPHESTPCVWCTFLKSVPWCLQTLETMKGAYQKNTFFLGTAIAGNSTTNSSPNSLPDSQELKIK